MLFFFDLLYFLILILALPYLSRYLFKKKYRTLLRHRLVPDIEPSDRKRIWVHAVSVGEVKSLKNLLAQLKKKFSDKEIVLSVTTPAGYELAKKEYQNQDIAVINSPLDFSFTVKKFINAINPDFLVLNELEIWPNWLTMAAKRNTRIFLINGRISEPAFNRYRKGMFLLRPFFLKIHRFLLQADIYRERFEELGIPPGKITVCGNIKADEAFNVLAHSSPDCEILEYLGMMGGERTAAVERELQENEEKGNQIVTFASTHISDEEVILPVIAELQDRFRFVIVPRHLERVPEIARMLDEEKIRYSTWSKDVQPYLTENAAGAMRSMGAKGTDDVNDLDGMPPIAPLLIFDRMGYLFHILKVSDIVYMGGTLERKIGGHNLYEPAVLGKPIIGGPWFNNFPDIGAELVEKGVYSIIHGARELAAGLLHLEQTDRDLIKQQAIDIVTLRKGSVQCILKEIRQHLFSN